MNLYDTVQAFMTYSRSIGEVMDVRLLIRKKEYLMEIVEKYASELKIGLSIVSWRCKLNLTPGSMGNTLRSYRCIIGFYALLFKNHITVSFLFFLYESIGRNQIGIPYKIRVQSTSYMQCIATD